MTEKEYIQAFNHSSLTTLMSEMRNIHIGEEWGIPEEQAQTINRILHECFEKLNHSMNVTVE